MIHRSQVGRQDVLKCLRQQPAAPETLLARFFGYELVARSAPSPPAPQATTDRPPPALAPVPPPPPTAEKVVFLRPSWGRRLDSGPNGEPEAPRLACEAFLQHNRVLLDKDFRPRVWPLPSRPVLAPWARLWPFLRGALGGRRESLRLDLRRLVGDIACRRPLSRLPWLHHFGWSHEAMVLVDGRLSLVPFWRDMADLLKRVRQVRGSEGLRVIRLWDGLPPKTLPPAGAPVLALSDLGVLSRDPKLVAAWREHGERLRRTAHARTALLPCPRDRWDDLLAHLWTCACWDRGTSFQQGRRGLLPLRTRSDEDRSSRAARFLTLLAPALRVEPGLLRSIRLGLSNSRETDVGTEFDVWNHEDSLRDVEAMMIRPTRIAGYRAAHADTVSLERKRTLINLLTAWHADCSETFRAAEILYLHACAAPFPPSTVQAGRDTQNRAVARWIQLVQQGDEAKALDLGFPTWQHREWTLADGTARNEEEFIAAGWAIAWRGEAKRGGRNSALIPEELDAEVVARTLQLLETAPAREMLWEVRQESTDLILHPWSPPLERAGTNRVSTGSPLGLICARRPQMSVVVKFGHGQPATYNCISVRDSTMRQTIATAQENCIELPEHLSIKTDCAELSFDRLVRPSWARRLGRDQGGLFAQLESGGIIFLLRWIPPGTFTMGSPEDERGRHKHETPHRVSFARGFWLGATPCTQEQWQAIMGENPSRFEGRTRPVEQVSLDDCRRFCSRLQERVSALEFRLPTEAEWEHACRAGTASAFNDGSDCTKPMGKDPALDRLGWYDGNSCQETHPVAEKYPNAWGLYDMHGNVWEWCADWYGDQSAQDMRDPTGPSQGVRCVVRGGAFSDDAGNNRSAMRNGARPGSRNFNLGFRLVAGQSAASGPSGRRAAG